MQFLIIDDFVVVADVAAVVVVVVEGLCAAVVYHVVVALLHSFFYSLARNGQSVSAQGATFDSELPSWPACGRRHTTLSAGGNELN